VNEAFLLVVLFVSIEHIAGSMKSDRYPGLSRPSLRKAMRPSVEDELDEYKTGYASIFSRNFDTILWYVKSHSEHIVMLILSFEKLADNPQPEMLRLSLAELSLRIKIMNLPQLGSSIEGVLSSALSPPSSTNIQRAIASLVEVCFLPSLTKIYNEIVCRSVPSHPPRISLLWVDY